MHDFNDIEIALPIPRLGAWCVTLNNISHRAASVFPALSLRLTQKLCCPWRRRLSCQGDTSDSNFRMRCPLLAPVFLALLRGQRISLELKYRATGLGPMMFDYSTAPDGADVLVELRAELRAGLGSIETLRLVRESTPVPLRLRRSMVSAGPGSTAF